MRTKRMRFTSIFGKTDGGLTRQLVCLRAKNITTPLFGIEDTFEHDGVGRFAVGEILLLSSLVATWKCHDVYHPGNCDGIFGAHDV